MDRGRAGTNAQIDKQYEVYGSHRQLCCWKIKTEADGANDEAENIWTGLWEGA